MTKSENRVERAAEFTPVLLQALNDELGWVLAGQSAVLDRIDLLAPKSSRAGLKRRSAALMNGSLLIYLFALWQSEIPEDFKEWLTADELEQFEAFEHVRDSAAHVKIGGGRAAFERKRRAFEARFPFAGLHWDRVSDSIDLSESSIVHECMSLMQGFSQQLIARFHSGMRPGSARPLRRP